MGENGSRITVVVVDQDAVARRGVRSSIDAQPDMKVVGEAADCDEALAVVRSRRARVVISEAGIMGRHCLELLADLRGLGRPVGLIVLTDAVHGETALRLVQSGAAAYLRKSSSPAEVVSAVRVVTDGGHVLEPSALDAVLQDYFDRCQHPDQKRTKPLSRREREVLTLIAEGRSTREIATDLGLSHRTVEVHRSHIRNKLRRHKTAHLVRYALREGLVSLD